MGGLPPWQSRPCFTSPARMAKTRGVLLPVSTARRVLLAARPGADGPRPVPRTPRRPRPPQAAPRPCRRRLGRGRAPAPPPRPPRRRRGRSPASPAWTSPPCRPPRSASWPPCSPTSSATAAAPTPWAPASRSTPPAATPSAWRGSPRGLVADGLPAHRDHRRALQVLRRLPRPARGAQGGRAHVQGRRKAPGDAGGVLRLRVPLLRHGPPAAGGLREEERAARCASATCRSRCPCTPTRMPAARRRSWRATRASSGRCTTRSSRTRRTCRPRTCPSCWPRLGLGAAELAEGAQGGHLPKELEASRRRAAAANIRGTPSLFFNGRPYELGFTEDQLAHSAGGRARVAREQQRLGRRLTARG